MDAKPSPCAQCMENMIHTATGIRVIGQTIGSVVKIDDVVIYAVTFYIICLWAKMYLLPFLSWMALFTFFFFPNATKDMDAIRKLPQHIAYFVPAVNRNYCNLPLSHSLANALKCFLVV